MAINSPDLGYLDFDVVKKIQISPPNLFRVYAVDLPQGSVSFLMAAILFS